MGDIYIVQWAVQGSSSIGFGMRHGDSLAVSWKLADKMNGLTVYKIGKDKLVGRWCVPPPAPAKITDETLYFLKALPSITSDD